MTTVKNAPPPLFLLHAPFTSIESKITWEPVRIAPMRNNGQPIPGCFSVSVVEASVAKTRRPPRRLIAQSQREWMFV